MASDRVGEVAPPALIAHLPAQVEIAHGRLAGHVTDTPCLESRTLGEILGTRVFLKFENLQFTASFKERGALNRLACIAESGTAVRGVIAASAGNHAQGLAYHASRMGLRAVIVMPANTPTVKVERTRRFGAQVLLRGETFDEAHGHALQVAAEQGLDFVHPFDDPLVIAGQGTVALEMLRAQPEIDTLVVAVGGGGLLAGMAAARAPPSRASVSWACRAHALRPWSMRLRAAPIRLARARSPKASPWGSPACSRAGCLHTWWTSGCSWTKATSSRPS